MPDLDPVREALVEDLAVAIAKRRGGQSAGPMARELLQTDSGSNLLLGLSEDATQAIYYDAVRWGVRFVPFDADGLDGIQGTQVEKLSHRHAVETFVAEHGDAWGWLHPRVRWVRV